MNRSFTAEIVEMPGSNGRRLLDQLFNHIEQPEFQTRFQWQPNDIALWDNRRLLHFAIWDYWPNERKGHRVSILGDTPFFDPAATDPQPTTIRLSGGTLA